MGVSSCCSCRNDMSKAGQPKHYLPLQAALLLLVMLFAACLLYSLEIPKLWHTCGAPAGIGVLTVAVLANLYVLSAFFHCVLVEPGVLPPVWVLREYAQRRTCDPAAQKALEHLEKLTLEEADPTAVQSTLAAAGSLGGADLAAGELESRIVSFQRLPWNEAKAALGASELKYCISCQVYRPRGASHCGYCERCILDHDHHCVVIGTCIGARNRRYFLRFNVGLVIWVGFVLGVSFVNLRGLSMPAGWGISATGWWVMGGVGLGLPLIASRMDGICCTRILAQVFACAGLSILAVVLLQFAINTRASDRSHVWSSVVLIVLSFCFFFLFLTAAVQQSYLICTQGLTVKQYSKKLYANLKVEPTSKKGVGAWLECMFSPFSPSPSLVTGPPHIWNVSHVEDGLPLHHDDN